MKIKFIYILFTILLCLNTVNANKLLDIKKSGILTVGIQNDLKPLTFLNKKKERIGFDIDIIKYIANNLNLKLNFVILNSSELISYVENENVDLSISAITHKEVEESNVDFSITYLYDGQILMTNKSSKYKNYKNLAGKNVGALNESNCGKIFEVISPSTTIIYFNNILEIKDALINNEIDAATGKVTLLYSILFNSKTKLKLIGRKFTIEPYGIVLPEDESKFRDAINLSIQKLVKDKTYNKIYKKWFHKYPSRRPVLWP